MKISKERKSNILIGSIVGLVLAIGISIISGRGGNEEFVPKDCNYAFGIPGVDGASAIASPLGEYTEISIEMKNRNVLVWYQLEIQKGTATVNGFENITAFNALVSADKKKVLQSKEIVFGDFKSDIDDATYPNIVKDIVDLARQGCSQIINQ